MKKFCTFFILAVSIVFLCVYWIVGSSTKAVMAVSQVNDNVITYSFIERIINHTTPVTVIVVTLLLLGIIWRKDITSFVKTTFLMFIPITFMVSCGPALVEKFETIKPNETAYVIPVEGSTKSQQGFMSVEFLDAKKVATKRIYLPQRKISTGRWWWQYTYIPTVSIIRVDRSPVTREWTGDTKTGTSKQDEALWVESSDSIGFGVGVNLTAMILEEDTSLYLYKYAGKSLSDIVDKNARGRVNAILSREFAKYTLEQGRDKKNDIINKVDIETTTYFKNMGITIANVGLSEGLVYEDKEIQVKINENFVAQMDIQIKDNERLSQEKTNLKNISIADAEATAAEKFARSAVDRKKQMDIEISLMEAKAKLTMAEKWNGQFPLNILPSNSPLLLNMGSK